MVRRYYSYSLCGSLGIEQVIDGVSASLETNNHEAVNLGYVFEISM